MAIWQLCANLLIPNCLRSNLSYSPLAALELYVNFVMTECFYLFCSVYRIEGDPARLRLKSLFATADDDLEVRCEEICVMWPVCGAICGLK